MSNPKTLLIAAAGTGGHIFPALVLAEKARAKGLRVVWVGTSKGLEKPIVEKAGFEFLRIRASQVLGKSIWQKMRGTCHMLISIISARKILRQEKPFAVICFGGYVSVPMGLAAYSKRIPLYLHEQNAVPGLSNRLLSRFAKRIFLGFPNSIQSKNTLFVGNPVRDNILKIRKTKPLTQLKNILIIGGSQGARSMNTLVLEGIKYCDDSSLHVWHQVGQKDAQRIKAAYQSVNCQAKVSAFIEDMASAYDWADLLICRAGALTVAEVMAVGIPAIFIPFPFDRQLHQVANANYLVNQQAASMILQSALTPEVFANQLKNLTLFQSIQQRLSTLKRIDSGDIMLSKIML